jgi:pyrroloquinoline quinone (PQQ) biosynthesis protein C
MRMNDTKLALIEQAWYAEVKRFNATHGVRRLINGELTITHYQALLREIYFYARESPPFFAMIPVFLRGAQRDFTKKMLQHACSEAGHDTLALRDLETLGVNTAQIPFERPRPETSALIGFSYYLIQYLNPVSYLGFVFHLEYLPTHFGKDYAEGLLRAGIPPAAMTFLGEHVEADAGHNRLMADYVEHLLRDERDVTDTIYAMRVTANLYARMIESCFQAADEPAPLDLGLNHAELTPGMLTAPALSAGSKHGN